MRFFLVGRWIEQEPPNGSLSLTYSLSQINRRGCTIRLPSTQVFRLPSYGIIQNKNDPGAWCHVHVGPSTHESFRWAQPEEQSLTILLPHGRFLPLS